MSAANQIIVGPAKGRIAAAWSPGRVETLWYPIDAMRWRHLPVIVSLERGGREVLAVVKKRDRPRRDWWFQLGTWGGDKHGWLRHSELPLEAYGRDPLVKNSPARWRPVDPGRFPHALPAPLPPVFGVRTPQPCPEDPVEELDPFLAHEGWPNPNLTLTLDAPLTRAECEARVLRAFRTSASSAGGGVGHRTRDTCADIPREIVLMSSAINAAWWGQFPDADGSAFDAVRSGWKPTKRDIADWVDALSWLSGLDPRARRILRLRAADPPWSFNQIARVLRASPGKVRADYQRALDVVFAVARKKGGVST